MAEILAFPSSLREPTDAEARELALDIRESWIVEAPAGSGKTSLLVARYLRLLAEAELESPESILAITFTRKATAELRERMLHLLADAAAGTPLAADASEHDRRTRATATAVLARDRQQGWRLLERPRALNIRTIDGLCAEITQSLPLLSGGGGRRQPVDDAGNLFELAAERTLRQLGGPDRPLHDALRTVLLHRDVNLANVRALLADMLREREQWGELLPLRAEELTAEYLDTIVRPRLQATLERVVCAALTRTAKSLPDGLLAELSRFAAEHADLPGYKEAPSPLHVCRGRHSPPGEVAEELEHWRALVALLLTAKDEWRSPGGLNVKTVGFEVKGLPKSRLSDLLTDFSGHPESERIRERLAEVRCLPPAIFPDEQWEVCRALFFLLRHALIELEVLFDERGECDFSAISLAARAVLRSPDGRHDLAASAGYGLAHLLVDELQDTSAGQFELFEMLTEHFDGHSSTVFLVGDPKQSIYLFRQARVERFLRTASTGRLGSVPLRSLRLRRNFRSQGALVQDFNNTFRQLLPSPAQLSDEATADVPFVAAEAARDPLAGPAAVWHTAVLGQSPLPVPGESPIVPSPDSLDAASSSRPELTRQHRLREAALTRKLVEDFAARWPTHPSNVKNRPPRMAILCRNRRHAEAITAELRRDRRADGGTGPVAFQAVDLEGLQERHEVLDALALTRALLHPADRVAWLALLRAPWCGLKLADLLTLTGDACEDDDGVPVATLVEERVSLLSDDGQQRLAAVWPTLALAQANTGNGPLSALVERTWLSLGGDRFLRSDERENVHSYLRLLRKLEADDPTPDVVVLEKRLCKLFATPRPDGDVEITTIHKSKGREWDMVVLPGLEQRPRGNTSDLLQWMELERDANDGGTAAHGAEIVLSPIAGKGRLKYPLSAWLSRLENAREAAERKRLFYVACTRAREELHLIGAVTRSASGALSPGANSLLQSAWPFARSLFERLPLAAPQGREQTVSPLDEVDWEAEPLALAAEADPAPRTSLLQRTPAGFDPLEHLHAARKVALPYAPPRAAPPRASGERPVGSFGVRAFGNVVHRFLHHIANRLADGTPVEALLAELPGWQPRLAASLRGEGLGATAALREAGRVGIALASALRDPAGRWILAPHSDAASERPLMRASGALVRADRVFRAGSEPTSPENQASCLWIVDFKTTDPGGRSPSVLEAEMRARYGDQLESYADIYRELGGIENGMKIRLGLYLPLGPHLIAWDAAEAGART